eukprot:TRINITY_DN419_c0_g1_i1.p1 TRINITY_DN419_c0_g1~~TRINITY_DN419_c0_g1_i1.p1  ORF type:complete len:315 (+),score=96.92 TRINITY_DN419_c0_g1_i1:90-1034(+)
MSGASAMVGVPVTKGLLLCTFLGTSLGRLSFKPVGLDAVDGGDVARLAVLPWCYGGIGEFVVGSLLFVMMQTLERWWGSRKFTSYLLVSGGMALILHVLLYRGTGWAPLKAVRPGPVSLIFALLVKYWTDVPSTSLASEKLFVYLSALWYGHTSGAAGQALMGVLGGLLASSTRLPFRKLLLPKRIAGWFAGVQDVLDPSDGKPKPTPGEVMAAVTGQATPDGPYQEQLLPANAWDMAGGRGGRGIRRRVATEHDDDDDDGGAPPAAASGGFGNVVVNPADVESLVAMGFEEQSARVALEQAGGSIEQALSYLT